MLSYYNIFTHLLIFFRYTCRLVTFNAFVAIVTFYVFDAIVTAISVVLRAFEESGRTLDFSS